MISVIMLTYNRECFIRDAIESILVQSYRDFEFIIINNGSSDKSGHIADEYAEKDNRVHVIHRSRGNIGAGRNTGLAHARGDYIAFIDDDDVTTPDFLEFLQGLIEEYNADVAICGATDKVFDERKKMSPTEALITLLWRKKYNAAFPTKLFRRSRYADLHFPEEGRFDDIAVMYRLLADARCVAYHGLPKYTFRRHPGNNSAWTTNHSLLDADTLSEYLNAQRARTEWLSKKFPQYAASFRYFEWSFMISMVEKIHRLHITGCEKYLEEMIMELQKHRKEFLACPEILDFEREWMGKYI